MAILVIAVLTIMLAGGFSLVSAERRSVSDQKSQISAFRLAEQGLEVYLVRRDSLLAATPGYTKIPGAKDSVRIALPGGFADVSLTRLRAPSGSQSGLYIARSKGTETAGVYAGTPQGVRTVAQYVLWESMPMQVLAGWTALSGLRKNGGAGTISGDDVCKDSAAVAGVVVPANPGFSGSLTNVTGLPAVDSVPPDSVHIDWNGIVNLGAITPTYTFPGGSPPPGWPSGPLNASYIDTTSTYYPTILVRGDLTLQNESGTGLLIVTGNLTMGGGGSGWRGVILAGGVITSNGNNNLGLGGIQGAVVSALNVKLNIPVPALSVANGTKLYSYNSCEVAKANMALGALVTLPNTWVDNWVEY